MDRRLPPRRRRCPVLLYPRRLDAGRGGGAWHSPSRPARGRGGWQRLARHDWRGGPPLPMKELKPSAVVGRAMPTDHWPLLVGIAHPTRAIEAMLSRQPHDRGVPILQGRGAAARRVRLNGTPATSSPRRCPYPEPGDGSSSHVRGPQPIHTPSVLFPTKKNPIGDRIHPVAPFGGSEGFRDRLFAPDRAHGGPDRSPTGAGSYWETGSSGAGSCREMTSFGTFREGSNSATALRPDRLAK